MNMTFDTFLHRILTIGVAVILVLIPFHAFLTVWLSTAIGHYTALRLWKEVLLILLIATAGLYAYRHPKALHKVWQQKYIRAIGVCIGLYILLTVILGFAAFFAHRVSLQALGYGFISNLRFLLFFVACIVSALYFKDFWVEKWQKILLYPAAFVLGIGLLQLLVLPPDVLRHFGYGPQTIAPFISVDQKVEFARAQSTLRGPNPLGAYMVIVFAAIVALYAKTRHYLLKFGILVSFVVLFGTYSRSAWIGAVVAVFGLGLLLLGVKARKILIGITALLLSLGVFSLVLLQDNNTVQNVVFHTDETSQSSRSSNEDRANAINGGFNDIIAEPLGRGPGTAGQASVYNNGQARIAENYFLQIGQEIGVVGLALFIAICGLVGKVLWDIRSKSLLPVILLVSLIGLTLVNFLSHAWADDTLAYIWWGFAGLAIGMYASDPKKRKQVQ